MIRWICKVKISNKISSSSLLNKLCLRNLDTTLETNRLCWFGHDCGSKGWINKWIQHEMDGE